MRLLFEMDKKDYDPNGSRFVRPSARAIIVKGNRIVMVRSQKYDYYKFPGGGLEAGETPVSALIREVREEAGMVVIPESVREFGYVHRVQKGERQEIFVQDNFYYFCEVEEQVMEQKLDPYEEVEKFTLEFVLPEKAIAVNRSSEHGDRSDDPHLLAMAEREARVLELLMREQHGNTKNTDINSR